MLLNTDDYCECGEEAIARVGQDQVPLCITHLGQWIKQVKEDHEQT